MGPLWQVRGSSRGSSISKCVTICGVKVSFLIKIIILIQMDLSGTYINTMQVLVAGLYSETNVFLEAT